MRILEKKDILLLAVTLLVGGAIGLAVPVLSGESQKRLVFALAGMSLPVAAVISGSPKKFFTLAFFLLIPVNIHYFLFKLYATHLGGAGGLYLVPADLPLAGLYAIWIYERAFRKRPMNLPLKAILLPGPFILVAALSGLQGENLSWSLYELVRWIRFTLIAVYVGGNLRRDNLGFFLFCIGCSIVVQSFLAVSQFVFHSSFGLTSLGIMGKGSGDVFVQQLSARTQTVRGAGTGGHPNVLGTYLVMLLPLYLSLVFFLKDPRWRALSLLVVVTGFAGLLTTLSRGAWISSFVAVSFLLAALTAYRLLAFKRLVLLVTVGFVVLASSVAIGWSTLEKRFTFDLAESIEFRQEYNTTAVRMFKGEPFLGVGLNNFTLALDEYDPARAAKMEEDEGVRAAVHNLYLLVLSETGIFGFLAFMALVGGVFLAGLRRARHAGTLREAVGLGVAAGVVGVCVHNLTEFTLLVEACLYTFAGLAAFVATGE